MSEETPLDILEDASESTLDTALNVTILAFAIYGGVDLGRRAARSIKSFRDARKANKEASENKETPAVN